MSTHNHLLCFVRFCAGSTHKIANKNLIEQGTLPGFRTISRYELCFNSIRFFVSVDRQLAKKNEQMWKQLDQQNKELEEKRKQFEREKAQYEEDQKSNDKKGLERSDSSSKSLK